MVIAVVAGQRHREHDDREPYPTAGERCGQRALHEMPDNAEAAADEVHVENTEHIRTYEGQTSSVSPPFGQGAAGLIRAWHWRETKNLVIPYACQQGRLMGRDHAWRADMNPKTATAGQVAIRRQAAPTLRCCPCTWLGRVPFTNGDLALRFGQLHFSLHEPRCESAGPPDAGQESRRASAWRRLDLRAQVGRLSHAHLS